MDSHLDCPKRALDPFSADVRIDPLARSRALNSSGVAAAPCIVNLQIADLWVGKESLEHLGRLSAFTDFGIDHHVLRVEGAHSQEPRRKHLRDGIDTRERLISDLAHVDGMGRAVGRICRLVLEIEKKKFLAKFSVFQAHAAWHTRIVSDDAASPQLMEPGVVHGEERTELTRRKPKNAKWHGRSP